MDSKITNFFVKCKQSTTYFVVQLKGALFIHLYTFVAFQHLNKVIKKVRLSLKPISSSDLPMARCVTLRLFADLLVSHNSRNWYSTYFDYKTRNFFINETAANLSVSFLLNIFFQYRIQNSKIHIIKTAPITPCILKNNDFRTLILHVHHYVVHLLKMLVDRTLKQCSFIQNTFCFHNTTLYSLLSDRSKNIHIHNVLNSPNFRYERYQTFMFFLFCTLLLFWTLYTSSFMTEKWRYRFSGALTYYIRIKMKIKL